jgi:hypothetical protein
MGPNQTTLVVGGQARLPKELASGGVFQLVVELDPKKGEIIEMSCAPCLPVVEKVLRELLVGIKLETEHDIVLEGIERRIIHRGKKAMSTAVKDLVREYREYKYQFSKSAESRTDGPSTA